jgi:hypothetical protein
VRRGEFTLGGGVEGGCHIELVLRLSESKGDANKGDEEPQGEPSKGLVTFAAACQCAGCACVVGAGKVWVVHCGVGLRVD